MGKYMYNKKKYQKNNFHQINRTYAEKKLDGVFNQIPVICFFLSILFDHIINEDAIKRFRKDLIGWIKMNTSNKHGCGE